jgi:tetratricopeptide (TPR) repeat protein
METNFWGNSTSGFHLLNILLHVFSALMLVRILRKLGIRGSWLAAAIFALHPVQVESVAWITELKNCLSGVFFLSAALAYLNYTEAGKRRSYILSLGLFILGLLSKTTIAPFPLAMLAVVWWKHSRLSWRQDIVPLLPFFLAGILFGLITLYVERTYIGTRGPEFEFSLIERCLIAGRAIWFYLSKVFLPVNLIFTYPRWSVSEGIWWQYLFPAAALMVGCILWAVRKVWRAPASVFFYFTAMLLPYLGFFSLFTFRYSFVADHYQYLAIIGPIVIGVGLVEMALVSVRGGWRLLKKAVSVMLLLTLGVLSWKQSRMYSDAETLYQTTITRNDNSWMAHNNLGLLLAKRGRTDEAIAHYQKALEINPNHAEAHNNLGVLLADIGRTDEAIAHYRQALEINPNYGNAHYNLGVQLADIGRTDEAMAHYQKALEINPNHVEAHTNLGLLLAKRGRTDEAIAHYQKALEINPNHGDAHYYLGIQLAQIGRTDEAIAHYRQALEINPDAIDALLNLSIAFVQKGQLTNAVSVLQKALASTQSAGDEARAKKIAQMLSKLYETINSSQVNSKTHAQ